MDTLSLLVKTLSSIYQTHIPDCVLDLVSDDIFACGLSNGLIINGKKDLEHYIESVKKITNQQVKINITSTTAVSDSAAFCTFTLEEFNVSYEYIISASSKLVNGEHKLCFVQVTNQSAAVKDSPKIDYSPLDIVKESGLFSYWIYDLETKSLIKENILGVHSKNDKIISNVPEYLIEKKIVHPEDSYIFRDCYKRIHDGVEKSTALLELETTKQSHMNGSVFYCFVKKRL